MNNAQPILCGTDFSPQAAQAADIAAALARRVGAPLILAHSIDERGEIPAHLRPQFTGPAQSQLTAEAARLRSAEFPVEERLVSGWPDDGLLQVAAHHHAGLTVLAASGHGALGRWVLGSISERVAESSPIPTLIVRHPAPLLEWARGGSRLSVLVGADFTPQSQAALRWVGELARLGPCVVTIAYVAQAHPHEPDHPVVDDALKAQLAAEAAQLLGFEPSTVFICGGSGRVDAQLLRLVEEITADLLVVGTHQWHGFQRLSHHSVSRRLLHESPVSIACIPTPEVKPA
jgi:nucleotide-binding universal stress UspA family protein